MARRVIRLLDKSFGYRLLLTVEAGSASEKKQGEETGSNCLRAGNEPDDNTTDHGTSKPVGVVDCECLRERRESNEVSS